MNSARRLSWLGSGVAALAISVLGMASAVAVAHVDVSVPAPGQLAAACTQLLPTATAVAVLVLLALAGTVLARGLGSGRRAWLAQHRLRRGLCVVRRGWTGGGSV